MAKLTDILLLDDTLGDRMLSANAILPAARWTCSLIPENQSEHLRVVEMLRAKLLQSKHTHFHLQSLEFEWRYSLSNRGDDEGFHYVVFQLGSRVMADNDTNAVN